MDGKIKKSHGDSFKLKVALAALKMDKTTIELCKEFAISSSQIYAWKKQLEDRGTEVFADKRKDTKRGVAIEKLHAIIGKLVIDYELLQQKYER